MADSEAVVRICGAFDGWPSWKKNVTLTKYSKEAQNIRTDAQKKRGRSTPDDVERNARSTKKK